MCSYIRHFALEAHEGQPYEAMSSLCLYFNFVALYIAYMICMTPCLPFSDALVTDNTFTDLYYVVYNIQDIAPVTAFEV